MVGVELAALPTESLQRKSSDGFWESLCLLDQSADTTPLNCALSVDTVYNTRSHNKSEQKPARRQTASQQPTRHSTVTGKFCLLTLPFTISNINHFHKSDTNAAVNFVLIDEAQAQKKPRPLRFQSPYYKEKLQQQGGVHKASSYI